MNVFEHIAGHFKGVGDIPGRSWWRSEHDEVPYVPPEKRHTTLAAGHPADYMASEPLADAVNTALLLRKPLIVTGRPGTGKTELAERIAYEFDLGPVLRFEAQSTSEANDLFYRFDYLGKLVASKLIEHGTARPELSRVLPFVTWGPLGKAILRTVPHELHALYQADRSRAAPVATGDANGAADVYVREQLGPWKRSVVLIDEIDKASRDFPNDLLNGIDRMEFRLRELDSQLIHGADRDSDQHPVVIITSNSERDLPPPFLRRCVFVQIPDPNRDELAAIVRRRVFGDVKPPGGNQLPPLYRQLIDVFCTLRDQPDQRYRFGTSEFIDLARTARQVNVDGNASLDTQARRLSPLFGAIAKHPDTADRLRKALTPQAGGRDA